MSDWPLDASALKRGQVGPEGLASLDIKTHNK